MGLLSALGRRMSGALGRDTRYGASLHRTYGGLSNDETLAMGPARLLNSLPSVTPPGRLDRGARREFERILRDLGGLSAEDLAALDDASLVAMVRQIGM